VLLCAVLWFFLSGCTATSRVGVAEERAVCGCTYLDTLSEISDMGRFQVHPKFSFAASESVLRRAEALGATHVVWVGDYPFGAAAMAYRCVD
jgi:hypothetical protein